MTDLNHSDAPEAAAAIAAPLSAIDKLRAAKAAVDGKRETITLKASQVEVSFPRFRAYGDWQKAARLAGKDTAAMNTIYITLVCLFDGQRLTLGDYQELVSASDHIAISNKMFGGDDEGN